MIDEEESHGKRSQSRDREGVLASQFDFDFLIRLVELQDAKGPDLAGSRGFLLRRCGRRSLLPFR